MAASTSRRSHPIGPTFRVRRHPHGRVRVFGRGDYMTRHRRLGRRRLSSARGRRRRRSAAILDRDDDDSLLLLEVRVHDHHPAPRAEHEPEAFPAPTQRCSKERELLERLNRAPDSSLRVLRQAVRKDQPLEILDGGRRELDPRHGLQLVEPDRLAGASLVESELSALERAGNAVEELDDVACIDIRLVDRLGQKRSSQRSLLRVRPFREQRELRGALGIQRDVQTRWRHRLTVHG